MKENVEGVKETKAMSKSTQVVIDIEKMSENTETSKKIPKMSGERTEDKNYEEDENDEGK